MASLPIDEVLMHMTFKGLQVTAHLTECWLSSQLLLRQLGFRCIKVLHKHTNGDQDNLYVFTRQGQPAPALRGPHAV
jgi:hypothetical protein